MYARNDVVKNVEIRYTSNYNSFLLYCQQTLARVCFVFINNCILQHYASSMKLKISLLSLTLR